MLRFYATILSLLLLVAAPAFGAGAEDPSPAVQRLTNIINSYPCSSPDGKQIVFQSNRSGNAQIWLMNRDGSEVMMLTDVPGEGAETPVWSPDGRLIAYATYVGEDNNDVFVMKADGSGQTRVTSGPVPSPSITAIS